METEFLRYNQFSKMMGEGSDIDESEDDDDALLGSMSDNQNMNDLGITDQPIKLNTSLMSESTIKLVRTIEERIERENLGPQKKLQNYLPFLKTEESSMTYCGDTDGDPSIIGENINKMCDDIEQGLNYLYARAEIGSNHVENTKVLAAHHSTSDQIQLNNTYNGVFYPNPQIIDPHSVHLSKLSGIKTESKFCRMGNGLKKRLGEKVETFPTELFQCRECKEKFYTKRQLEHHLNEYAHRTKTEQKTPEKTCDQFQLNKRYKKCLYLDSQLNNYKLSGLDSSIVKPHLGHLSEPTESKTENKSLGIGNGLKKRLGEKVRIVPTPLFQCRECGRNFSTNGQLHHHLIEYSHRRQTKQNTQVEKEMSRKERDYSPEKKVICQHCQEKFCGLETLLYHLRAEHQNRKKHIKESAVRTEYIYSKEEKRYSSREKTRDKMKSEADSDYEASHKTEAHRDRFLPDRRKFVCIICSSMFLTKYDLKKHIQEKKHYVKTTSGFKVHELRSNNFVCKFCSATFSKFQDRMNHLNEAHKPR